MSAFGEEPEDATTLNPDELEGPKFKHIVTRGELELANVQYGLQWLRHHCRRGLASWVGVQA